LSHDEAVKLGDDFAGREVCHGRTRYCPVKVSASG
jgi:hypothetical protein